MEPRYYAGEVIYLNPARSPNPGDFVFITVKEAGFPAEVCATALWLTPKVLRDCRLGQFLLLPGDPKT
jgi:hypothetical protein